MGGYFTQIDAIGPLLGLQKPNQAFGWAGSFHIFQVSLGHVRANLFRHFKIEELS